MPVPLLQSSLSRKGGIGDRRARDRPGEELYTVDELAAATGMTVRTTRYYAGLGLLPPPSRRGRMAYYTAASTAPGSS